MLQYVARHFEVDYLIWTGDNIAHDIFYQSGFNLTEQTFVITQAINKYLSPKNPNMMVFPIQGNHEGSPVNIFDYYNGTTAWITEELAVIWSQWLDEQAVQQMNSTGYYSMYDPAKNLRVIALDTQACNTGNYLLYENPTDPYGQLAFVREQLYLAEANNESVYFIGHIPMAGGGCNYAWTTRFEALVDRFSHIVRAQFYGHTHHDTFTIHRSLIDHSPMSIQFIAPSMTT
jgi:sphingomyelin phosphodiesterase